MAKFSVVIIVKNEEKNIKSAIESARGVDEILVVDTGSTDKTIEIAKECGVEIKQTKYILKLEGEEYKQYAEAFKKEFGIEPTLKEGIEYFNFGQARQEAGMLAKNDWVFEIDADETVEWDIKKIESQLDTCNKLSYNYVFSHDDNGKPVMQYSHSKFYNRKDFIWDGITHEVLLPIVPEKGLYTQDLTLRQWSYKFIEKKCEHCDSIKKELVILKDNSRKSIDTPRLEYQLSKQPYNSRYLFYYGRQLYFANKNRETIKILNRYLKVSTWVPERVDAYTIIADTYWRLGVIIEAEKSLLKAIRLDITRREPFADLCKLYLAHNQWQKAVCYAKAAMEIPLTENYHFNNMSFYKDYFHYVLYYAYYYLGREEEAKKHHDICLSMNPNNQKYINDKQFFN